MVAASPAGDEFLQQVGLHRRQQMIEIRKWLLDHLPDGYEERVGSGLSYVVPLSKFPEGYRGDPTQPLGAVWLAHTKVGFSLHLMTIYGDVEAEAIIREGYAKKRKKLDMGKACIRFKALEDLEKGVIKEILRKVPPEVFVDRYKSRMG